MVAPARRLLVRTPVTQSDRDRLRELERLYDGHAAAAYGAACGITADPDLAQAIVQDVLLETWRDGVRAGDDEEMVRTRLVQVTRCRAIASLRRGAP